MSISTDLARLDYAHMRDAKTDGDGKHVIADIRTGADIGRMDALEAAAFVRLLKEQQRWPTIADYPGPNN